MAFKQYQQRYQSILLLIALCMGLAGLKPVMAMENRQGFIITVKKHIQEFFVTYKKPLIGVACLVFMYYKAHKYKKSFSHHRKRCLCYQKYYSTFVRKKDGYSYFVPNGHYSRLKNVCDGSCWWIFVFCYHAFENPLKFFGWQ